MPILWKDVKPKIEIYEGIELATVKCIRNMPVITTLPSGVTSIKSKWRLFKVQTDPHEPSIPVYDDAGYFRKGNNVYALAPIKDKAWIKNWVKSVPNDIIEKLEYIAIRHGLDETDLVDSLSQILLKPIPRLRNPHDVAKMTKEQWSEFIESTICPGAEKDSRLKLVFKSHLLRGNIQRYNPHTLMITNPSTGKTSYYDITGLRIDKASKNRLIGYSDAQKPHRGTIDNLDTILCIEQIESQTATDILAFLLTFMEKGEARSETGAEGFIVKGNCPIVLTANPTGYRIDRIDTFRALIDHLSGNLVALGRRFGVIIYGDDYGKVQIKKPVGSIEWQNNMLKFRSVEEYVLSLIKSLFENSSVHKWLEKPLPEYEERGKVLTKKVIDDGIEDFLTTHFESAYPHIRGTALNCAIIDLVPKLVKVRTTGQENKLLIIDILSKAEGYLREIVAINLESVANMVRAKVEIIDLIFKQLPQYIQELILTVNNYLQKLGRMPTREVSLDTVGSYAVKQYYQYFSMVTNHLDYITPERLNNYNRFLEKYWYFKVIPKEQHIYTIDFVYPRGR